MSRHASKDLVQTTSKLDLNVLSVSVICWLSECAAKLSTWYKLDTSLYSITNNTSRIEIISDCSQNSKPLINHVSWFCSKSLSQQINPRPYRSQCQCVRLSTLILPNHHLKSLSIHQAPLSATIRRKALDKRRRPWMRIRPHHVPAHRKRLHLRIHTLLADLLITIRIERHHRTVYLPLRTRRHLHIPEIHPPASTSGQRRNCLTTSAYPNPPHSSRSPTIIPVNVNAPAKTTTSSKKPNTPHANDNTSSWTAHTPQKAAPMPQTSKTNAKPQAKAPQSTKFLSMPMQTSHLQDTCQWKCTKSSPCS